MVGASVGSFRDAQIKCLNELERMNGINIGGITITMDIDRLRKMIPKEKCDCLECYINQREMDLIRNSL